MGTRHHPKILPELQIGNGFGNIRSRDHSIFSFPPRERESAQQNGQ